MRKAYIVTVLVILLTGFTLSAQPYSELMNTPTATEEITTDGSLYMFEEEKLARDVYIALYEQWGSRVFYNIANAEQQHMDQVFALLLGPDSQDAFANVEVGVFTNPELAKLYTDLVAQGSKSITDAYIVGATIEDLDISDLQKYLAANTDDEITTYVYSNLLRGSENHMRAFVNQLSRYNATYEAQYISSSDLKAILTQR